MSFGFDAGQEGGAEGPFLSFTAKGTEDGEIPAKTFYIRDKDDDGNATRTVTNAFDKGVIFDIENMRTGWMYGTGNQGEAPEWVWNETIARFGPKPDDKKWVKGFEIKVALNKTDAAVWQQGAAAAFEGIKRLMQQIGKEYDENKGKLPVVKMTGTEFIKYKKGSSNIPLLSVVKWVPRPEALEAKPDEPETSDDAAEDGDEW